MLFIQITPLRFTASSQLSDLLGSTEFHNALRKYDIDWIKIPPMLPARESIIKLLKMLYIVPFSTMAACLP